MNELQTMLKAFAESDYPLIAAPAQSQGHDKMDDLLAFGRQFGNFTIT